MQTKFDENAYSALLERIYSITPSVQNVGFSGDAYKPGLAGMQTFDFRLGHPWKQYRCIHVAGTNGKGSVASMIAAALAGGDENKAASGFRVGLYTSPHLVDFRERMKVVSADGWTMPSKEEVWEFFQTYLCDSAGELDTRSLSFFEKSLKDLFQPQPRPMQLAFHRAGRHPHNRDHFRKRLILKIAQRHHRAQGGWQPRHGLTQQFGIQPGKVWLRLLFHGEAFSFPLDKVRLVSNLRPLLALVGAVEVQHDRVKPVPKRIGRIEAIDLHHGLTHRP